MTKFVLPLCSTTDRPLHHFSPLFLFQSSKSAKTNQVKDYNQKGEKEGVKKKKKKKTITNEKRLIVASASHAKTKPTFHAVQPGSEAGPAGVS